MNTQDRRRQMEGLLARRRREGLTFRELSESSGVPIPTLAWWNRKLEGESRATAPLLVPVEIVEDAQAGPVTIDFGRGVRVVVEAGFDPRLLTRIVSALSSAC